MDPTLTSDLASAIDAQGDVPIRALHPVTGKTFVVISEESFQRLRPLFEFAPASLDEKRLQMREVGRRAGWDDPEMDAYDRYDEARSQAQQ